VGRERCNAEYQGYQSWLINLPEMDIIYTHCHAQIAGDKFRQRFGGL